MRIRIEGSILREVDRSILVQKTSGIFWHMAFGNKNFEIVSNRDKSSIEHPMYCSGKGQPVANGVWTFRSDRLNMCRLNFGTTAAIDQS